MTQVPGRVTVVVGDDHEGKPIVGIEFSDCSLVVDPQMVAYHDGKLIVQVPATIDLPAEAVVIEKWLPPTTEQLFLAVEDLSPVAIERLLVQEQMGNMGDSMGVLVKRAVARAVMGETGAD